MQDVTPNRILPTAVAGRPSTGSGLTSGAVRHLSHEMHAGLQTILGHSELLGEELLDRDARDSAAYIHAAAVRLGGLCDDVADALQLPELVDRGETRLVAQALLESLAPVAAARGVRVRLAEGHGVGFVVDASVARLVAHLLEHVVATALSDVTIDSYRSGDGFAVVRAEPEAPGLLDGDNGVVAIAAMLLRARGGDVADAGEGIEVHVPALRWA